MKRLSLCLSLSLSIVVLGSVLGLAAAQSASNVFAYYTYDYDVIKNNWNMSAAHVACAAVNGSASFEWRSKYGWTGFCGPTGPQYLEACGLCLKVTNTATGDEEKVRIVDTCGLGGLDMDFETAFRPIDTDGSGHRDGHLIVDYEFVDCDDEEPLGPGESNVTAYYPSYNVTYYNWSMTAANVFCAAANGSASFEWRSKYGWTGFCGSVGPKGLEACGLCLNVTNLGTDASEIVRIVDTCGFGSLELDYETAFRPIDTDGKGYDAGHLFVSYNFVDCGDSEQNIVLVSSQ